VPYADIVGSVVRVGVIRALADSVAHANAQLSMLDLQRARAENVERQREIAMRAAAAVEVSSASEPADIGEVIPSYLR